MPHGPRSQHTKENYEAILEAFRIEGVKFSKVAALVGLSVPTVRKIYWDGWVGCGVPIKVQLERDRIVTRAMRYEDSEDPLAIAGALAGGPSPMMQEAVKRVLELERKTTSVLAEAERRLNEIDSIAQARVQEAEEEAKSKVEGTLVDAREELRKAQQVSHRAEKAAEARMALVETEAKQKLMEILSRAKMDAAETIADEANGAKFGRKAALGAVALAALVVKDAQYIAQQLRAAIGDISKMTPREAIRMAREMVRLVEAGEKSLILALQAERLRVGQPTEVIGVSGIDGSFEEREIKLKAVQRALERAKARSTGGGQLARHAAPDEAAEATPSIGEAPKLVLVPPTQGQ